MPISTRSLENERGATRFQSAWSNHDAWTSTTGEPAPAVTTKRSMPLTWAIAIACRRPPREGGADPPNPRRNRTSVLARPTSVRLLGGEDEPFMAKAIRDGLRLE